MHKCGGGGGGREQDIAGGEVRAKGKLV